MCTYFGCESLVEVVLMVVIVIVIVENIRHKSINGRTKEFHVRIRMYLSCLWIVWIEVSVFWCGQMMTITGRITASTPYTMTRRWRRWWTRRWDVIETIYKYVSKKCWEFETFYSEKKKTWKEKSWNLIFLKFISLRVSLKHKNHMKSIFLFKKIDQKIIWLVA